LDGNTHVFFKEVYGFLMKRAGKRKDPKGFVYDTDNSSGRNAGQSCLLAKPEVKETRKSGTLSGHGKF